MSSSGKSLARSELTSSWVVAWSGTSAMAPYVGVMSFLPCAVSALVIVRGRMGASRRPGTGAPRQPLGHVIQPVADDAQVGREADCANDPLILDFQLLYLFGHLHALGFFDPRACAQQVHRLEQV